MFSKKGKLQEDGQNIIARQKNVCKEKLCEIKVFIYITCNVYLYISFLGGEPHIEGIHSDHRRLEKNKCELWNYVVSSYPEIA